MIKVRQTSKWSEEDDNELIQLVEQEINQAKIGWELIASKLSNPRRGKQCRERWRNQLDPNLTHQPFTAEEDQKIIEIVNEFGRKWSYLAELLPGRSENGIKNRFYSNLAKKPHVSLASSSSSKRSNSKEIKKSSKTTVKFPARLFQTKEEEESDDDDDQLEPQPKKTKETTKTTTTTTTESS